MRNTESFVLGFVTGLLFVLIVAVGYVHEYPNVQRIEGKASAPVAAPVNTQALTKKIDAQQKQIQELYNRTEYLKSVLEQVIDVINTVPQAAPQGNAL